MIKMGASATERSTDGVVKVRWVHSHLRCQQGGQEKPRTDGEQVETSLLKLHWDMK